jgi:hypothetical protein
MDNAFPRFGSLKTHETITALVLWARDSLRVIRHSSIEHLRASLFLDRIFFQCLQLSRQLFGFISKMAKALS